MSDFQQHLNLHREIRAALKGLQRVANTLRVSSQRVALKHLASLGSGYNPSGMMGEQFNMLVYSQALAAALGLKGPYDPIYQNPRGAWARLSRMAKDNPHAASMDPSWFTPAAFSMYRVLFDQVKFLRIPEETKGEILDNCLMGLGTDYERIPAVNDDGTPIMIQKKGPDGKIQLVPQMIETNKPSLRKPVVYAAVEYANMKAGILSGEKTPEDVAKLAASFARNRGMDVLRQNQQAKNRFQHTIGEHGEHIEMEHAVGDETIRSFEGVEEAAQSPEAATALIQVLKTLPDRSKALLYNSLEDYIEAHFDDVGLDRVKASDPYRGRDLALGYVRALQRSNQDPNWNAILQAMPAVDPQYGRLMLQEGKPAREQNIHPNDWTKTQAPLGKLFQQWVQKNQRALEVATRQSGLSSL